MDVAALPGSLGKYASHDNFDREQVAVTRITYTRWRGNGHRNGPPTPRVATDLATQLVGTGWLTEGMAWDDQAKNPAGSSLSGTVRDASGRKQRFTKPLLAQRCTVLVCYCATYGHLASCQGA